MDEEKRVPLKNRPLERSYESVGDPYSVWNDNAEQRREAEERQSELSRLYNETDSKNKRTAVGTEIGIWEAARTPNGFNVNAQQALSPFMHLSKATPNDPQNVMFFDIEAIGTPQHMRGKDSLDLFAMTELSFGGTNFNGEDFVRSKSEIMSIAVAPGKGEYKRLKEQINQLKSNPLAAISKDMHRTLLDLAKYSDKSKFEEMTDNYGNKFLGITGHARIPAANSALTRNVLGQSEAGLENLLNATPVEKALNILQRNVKKTNSVLGGYNIDKYDIPALKGIASTNQQKFLNEASMNALDFYHAYSATTKTPYQDTGGSMRQEHIHQYLIDKKKIHTKKSNYLYHLAADDIQANIDLAKFTTGKIMNYLKEENKSDYALNPTILNTNNLKVGDQLFSYQSGFFDKNKHKHNLVGRMEDGKMAPRWKNLDTSLPSNESFTVAEFIDGFKLPGTEKTGFGIRLDSRDVDGKSILLASETMEELAQQIHGSFLPLDQDYAKGLRDLKVKHDQAFREYERMFDHGNGWNKMNQYYGYLRDSGGIVDEAGLAKFVRNQGGSEELSLKFPHMTPRMEAERYIWANSVKALSQSGLTDEQKSLALRYIKGHLDELGDNKATVTAPGSKFFKFTFGSKDHERVLNAKDTDSIKGFFRSYINGRMTGERVGDPEKGFKKHKINELSNFIIEQFNLSPESTKAKEIKELADGMIQEVHSGGKIETALTSMSNIVRDQVESVGTDSFTREVTNQVTPQRRLAIRNLENSLPEVIHQSIEHARTQTGSKDAIKNNKNLNQFLSLQDERIRNLFAKNFGLHGMNSDEAVKRAGDNAAKYKQLVGEILESYSHNFHTEVRFFDSGDGSKNPLLILADKKSGVGLGKINTYEELVKNPNLATIELPTLDEDLKVRWGSNRKASVVRSGFNKTRGTYHSVSPIEALEKIKGYARTANELHEVSGLTGKKNSFINIGRGLRYRVSNEVDPVFSNANRRLPGFDDKGMYDLPSAIGGEIRSNRWDVTGFAEKWYEDNYLRLGFRNSPERIREIAKERGVSFFDALGQRERSIALSGEEGLIGTAANAPGLGLRGSMFGINNRAGGRGYIATAGGDARTYMALGNYYSDSVENPHKTANYRKLSKEHTVNALNRAGKNEDYRYLNSFISDKAFDLLSAHDEWRGLTLQSGYMTDEEIATKLKMGDKINEYKEMINKSDAPNHVKRQMKKALDMGMLSTSEGLAMIDYEMMRAFDGIDEVRMNMNADEIMFNNKIEKAIEEQAAKENLNLGNGDWKKKGVMFDQAVKIDIDDLLSKDGKATLGEYTKNGITSNIETSKHFRKGDSVSILGFSVDDANQQTLILGRERKTGHGLKIVTESGFRGTTVPMLGEILEDLYGKGTEVVVSHLSEKKGANDLAALIRGYDLQIRRYQGENSEGLLDELYSDVKNTLGIDTEKQTTGQYTVSSTIGLDGQELDYNKREEFSKKWMGKLGLEREAFADITMAHDVWTRQGGLNNAKITTKEITQLEKGYRRTGIADGLEETEHLKWLRETVYGESTSPEVRAKQAGYKDTIKAVLNYRNGGWAPQENDIVIDYTAETNAPVGKTNAEIQDGIIRMSKDAFEPIPEPSSHKQNYTIADYTKTIINAGSSEFVFETGERGSVSNHLMNNKSSMYMKLPEWASQEHIPLIDTNSMMPTGHLSSEDRVKFLNEMQGHYARIARSVQEHDSINTSPDMTDEEIKKVEKHRENLRNKTNREIDGLLQTIESSTSNHGMSEVMSRRLEMSSQFQFGGVNPLMAYQKKKDKWVNSGQAKEGQVYMNRSDVRNLIGDNAINFAKSWGLDTSAVNPKDLTEFVLDQWNKHDTYGTTIRYPSIDSSTSQSMKIKISEAVGTGQVVGLRGMTERISGDFDGDNIAVLLSHYGIGDDKRRDAVIGEIAKMNKFDTSKNLLQVQELMDKSESQFRENLATRVGLSSTHEDIINASEQFFGEGVTSELTIGGHTNEETRNYINEAIRDSSGGESWGKSKNSYLDDSGQYQNLALAEHDKSILARAVSTTIGSVDNTRFRMSAAFNSLSETRYKLFKDAQDDALRYTREDYVRDTSMVDEFLREYSQKSISAKKAEGGQSTNVEAVDEIFEMIKKVNSPGSATSYDQLAADLSDKLFKDSPYLEIGEGEIYRGTKEAFIKESLQLLGDAEDTFSSMGFNGYRQSSLMMGASQGIGLNQFSDVLQKGEHIPGASDVLSFTNEIAKELGYERMDQHIENYENMIGRIYENKAKTTNSILNSNGAVLDIMNQPKDSQNSLFNNANFAQGQTIKEGVGDIFGDMASSIKKSFGGSAAKFAGVGAAAFGGLWATNALMKKTPTPEGLQEMAPVAPETLVQPTARVVENTGEHINIQINAKSAGSISPNDIAAMVNNEVMAMSNMQMKTNVNVNDNSQTINGRWLEDAVANAMNKGYAY